MLMVYHEATKVIKGTEVRSLSLSHRVIGAAIEVHRFLGPGLLEVVYEEALCRELSLRGIDYERQITLPLCYKGKC
jgi:GxxExxY protein